MRRQEEKEAVTEKGGEGERDRQRNERGRIMRVRGKELRGKMDGGGVTVRAKRGRR